LTLSSKHDPIKHRQRTEGQALAERFTGEPFDGSLHFAEGALGNLNAILLIDRRANPGIRRPVNLCKTLGELREEENVPLWGRTDFFEDGVDPLLGDPFPEEVSHRTDEDVAIPNLLLGFFRHQGIVRCFQTIFMEMRGKPNVLIRAHPTLSNITRITIDTVM